MTKLLIDGDLLVHRATAAVERDCKFDEDFHILMSKPEDALYMLEEQIHELTELAGTEDVVLTFSDDHRNWRKDFWPAVYKHHRKGVRKPLAYYEVRDRIALRYSQFVIPSLEADDVMGLLQDNDSIIWSPDKDLKQIPGKHLIDDEVITIHPDQAYRFHMYQTLAGDRSDGYPGCPGIGDVKAKRFTDGAPVDELWSIVLYHYKKAGQGPTEALNNARMSFILRPGYFDNGKVKLWEPL